MATASLLGAFVPLPMPSPEPEIVSDGQQLAALLPSNALDVIWEESGQTLWCWAAVAACIARFYQPEANVQQCEIAAQCLNLPCCISPESCNVMWHLEAALGAVGHSTGVPSYGPLDITRIAQEIDARRPIGCHIAWAGGRGHFVAICGYDMNTMDILVLDPATHLRPVPLDEFTYAYDGAGSWEWHYLTL